MTEHIASESRSFPFSCPVCGCILTRRGGTLVCEKMHSYDISSAGYVNLLRMSSPGTHGDDKIMSRARRDFLDAGYYGRIADTVANAVCSNLAKPVSDCVTVLDAGCGEGSYLSRTASALCANGYNVCAGGIDISKDIISIAAKRYKNLDFAVGSVYMLPVGNEVCDVIISMFAPFPENELLRTVKSNGFIVRAIPLRRHLWELKALLYEDPRENDETAPPEHVEELARYNVEYKITLNREEMKHLFMMTPYYYRTSPSDAAKLEKAEPTELTVSVAIIVYSPEKFH